MSLLDDFTNIKGNSAIVINDENGKVQTLIFQTRLMKEVAKAYPETALFDTTFETNVNGYNIFGMYGQTAIGKGFPIFLALNFNGKGDTLREMLESIQDPANDFVVEFDDLVVGVVDKDFTEESVLKEYFPNATFLLCQFHVIKYVSAEVSKEVYGLSSPLRKKVRDIVHMMVYSLNEEDYNQALCALKKSLGNDESHPFWQYWMMNWDTIKFRWVTYLRDEYPHFGNTTNNRIESAWNRLKNQTSPHSGIASCIQGVFEYLEDLESLFCGQYYNLVNGTRVRQSHNMMFRQLIDRLSHWAWRLVQEQNELLLKVQYTICEKDPSKPKVFSMKNSIPNSENNEYIIVKETMKCSCSFMIVYHLPCRHVIFYAIKYKNPELLHDAVHKRWVIHPLNPPFDNLMLPTYYTQFSCDSELPVTYQRVRKGDVISREALVLDDKEKWNYMMGTLCSDFASTLSKMGHCEFQNYSQLFQQLSSLAREGQKGSDLKIVLIDQNHSVNEQEVNCIVEDKYLGLSQKGEKNLDAIGEISPAAFARRIDDFELIDLTNEGMIPTHDNELDIIKETKKPCLSFKKNFNKLGRPRISSKASKQKQKQYRIYIKQHILSTGGHISVKHLHKLIQEEQTTFEQYLSKFKVNECINKRPSAAYLTPSNAIISDCEFLLGQKIVLNGLKKIKILTEIPVSNQGTRTEPILRIAGVGMFHYDILKLMADIWEHRHHQILVSKETHKQTELVTLQSISPQKKSEPEYQSCVPSTEIYDEHYLAAIEWINQATLQNLGTVLPGHKVDDVLAKSTILSELKLAPTTSCFIPKTTINASDIYTNLVRETWLCNWIIITISKILVSNKSVYVHESFCYMRELKNYLKPKTLYSSITSNLNIFIPFNFNNIHWTAIWIDKSNKTIEFYESTNLDYYKKIFHSTVLPFLKIELQDANIEWKSQITTVPVQLDGYNCGVLCLLFLIHKLNPRMLIKERVPVLTSDMGQTLRLYFLYLLVQARQRGSVSDVKE
jgi:hypothetical protein